MEHNVAASLREHLSTTNQEFRALLHQHQEYEARLNELTSLTYPTDDEVLEETLLKKKKLLVKDKMEAMLLRYKREVIGK